jgi:hypothetical protein
LFIYIVHLLNSLGAWETETSQKNEDF